MTKKNTPETPEIETPTESNAVRTFRAKTEAALAAINSIQQFRDADEMVDFVFRVGRSLFDQPLDQMEIGAMIRQGGKLTGAYAYLGQKSARARAERDVYEQKADEMEKEYVHKKLKEDGKYKVTNAKAEASIEYTELREMVIQKDAEKNQFESITNATNTMIMFIQSAIRVKENERYAGKKMHD